jgi:hypothetical protein
VHVLEYLGAHPLTFRGGGGGYGYLFRLEFIFRTTRELEYLFIFCRAKREFFFPEFNIRLSDKNSESYHYFFSPPKSEYFFQHHWVSEYFFLEKKIIQVQPWMLEWI